jgi:regulator of sirC expression with transglutaminase-like and TPR domain
LLMQHDEEDPYERRDRGYILQHLERNDLAKDDLNYFVEECPEDPTIELVQSQISELEENSKTYH